jgi:hypothetical protein
LWGGGGRPALDESLGDESGYTALFVLACAGRADSVALLLAGGGDATAGTKRGKTLIYKTLVYGYVEVCHVEL